MSRNVIIDILRIVFALVVVMHHLFPNQYCGYLAVDFFFIVSGFFLMKSFKKYDESERPNNLRFCVHKLLSFLPYLIIAEAMATIVVMGISLADNGDLGKAFDAGWKQFENIFLLSMLGLYKGDATWYLSAMMIATAILYPCLCWFGENFSKKAAPVIGLALLLAILLGTGRTNYVDELLLGIVCKGLILGISNMCLGIFSYEVVEHFKRYDVDRPMKAICTATEVVCYAAVLLCIFAVNPRGQSWRAAFELIIILLIAIGVTATMSGLSYSADLLTRNESVISRTDLLAVSSLLIYLNHQYIIRLWGSFKIDTPDIVSAVMVVLLMAAASAVCYYITNLLVEKLRGVDFRGSLFKKKNGQ